MQPIVEGTYKHGIKGFVKPGFEPVVRHLEKLGIRGLDKLSQLCVSVGQEFVIDVTMAPKG